MTRPAWNTLSSEQQRVEWERFNAWRARQPSTPIPHQQARHAAAVTSPEPKKFNAWPWIAGLGAMIIMVGLTVITADRTTVYGDMTVVTDTNALTSVGITEGCQTSAGYSDVAEGASVTVRDSTNAIIAMG